MGLIDNFLDALKLNDDFDEDEAFIDDDFDEDEEYESTKVKPRFFKRMEDSDDLDDGFDDDPEEPKAKKKPAAKAKPAAKEPKETVKQPARKERQAARKQPKPAPKRRSASSMEVSVIKPVSMEDGREICDTLLDDCTVVLNLEGLDVDLAQRIIDFTCGACYSIGGSIQMISSYIFILTPASVDITADYQTLLDDAFDIPAMRQY